MAIARTPGAEIYYERAGSGVALLNIGGTGGDVAQVDRSRREPERPGSQPGQVEQVAHQPVEPARLAEDGVAGLGRVGRGAVGGYVKRRKGQCRRARQIARH